MVFLHLFLCIYVKLLIQIKIQRKQWSQSYEQLLNFVLNLQDIALQGRRLFCSDCCCGDWPTDTTGSSEGCFTLDKTVDYAVFSTGCRQCHDYFWRITISCNDDKFDVVFDDLLKNFIYSFPYLFEGQQMLKQFQYFCGELQVCEWLKFEPLLDWLNSVVFGLSFEDIKELFLLIPLHTIIGPLCEAYKFTFLKKQTKYFNANCLNMLIVVIQVGIYHSKSLKLLALKASFLSPFTYNLNLGIGFSYYFESSLLALLTLSIPLEIVAIFDLVIFLFSPFITLSTQCFFPSAFLTIFQADSVPGSNRRMMSVGCSFLIFFVFSCTLLSRSFSRVFLKFSGIFQQSTSCQNRSSSLKRLSPLNVLVISSMTFPLSPSRTLLLKGLQLDMLNVINYYFKQEIIKFIEYPSLNVPQDNFGLKRQAILMKKMQLYFLLITLVEGRKYGLTYKLLCVMITFICHCLSFLY